ncbi:MAG: hypothetical protein ACFFBP_14950 [Promethearchaeota archaeon]
MGKKSTSLGIKTSRYYTKICVKCDTEYPNWFTNCPNCGAVWNENEAREREKSEDLVNKNIKIVVKITEEDFNEEIVDVKLIFSADQGKTWYQMNMNNQIDHYMAEINKVPQNSVIIYYIEVYLANGEKIVENNEGKYFYYKVGVIKEETKEEPPLGFTEQIKENIATSQAIPQTYDNIPIEQLSDDDKKKLLQKNLTIFGKPQTQIDPNLITCPNCNSKIKNIWTSCPICKKEIT